MVEWIMIVSLQGWQEFGQCGGGASDDLGARLLLIGARILNMIAGIDAGSNGHAWKMHRDRSGPEHRDDRAMDDRAIVETGNTGDER
jgi:hypothetical protein